MTKSLLSIAAAVIAATTLFGSAAEACISCNYVPEVVNTPVRGANAVQKKRVVVAKAARTAPAQKQVPSQVAPKKDQVAVTEPAAAPSATTSRETSAPTEARLLAGAPAVEAPTVEDKAEPTQVADLGCKKFIPTAGVTVSVPCQ